MCLNPKRKTMISKSIAGFEKAHAKIEVYVDVVESPNSTLPFEKLVELSNGECEKMEKALAKNNGIPFDYVEKMSNGAFLIESAIVFDTATVWGSLLDDKLVQLLLKEGLATWVFAGGGGIRFTKKMTRDKLNELNISTAEIYNHPLHEWFSTSTGATVNKNNFLQLLLRNS